MSGALPVAVTGKADGGAVITIGDAAPWASDARFRISRPDYADRNLQQNGNWQGSEADLTADAVRRTGNDLVLELGPDLCRRLEEGTYYFELTGAGRPPTPMAWPDIPQPLEPIRGSLGAGLKKPAPPPKPVQTLPPEPPKIERPEPVVVPDPPPPEPGNWLKIGIGGAVLLIVIAALVFYLRSGPPPAPAPVPVAENTPPPVPPPPPPPAPPDADGLSMADLTRGEPSVMLAQAQKRMATKPQDALLLLEVAGSDRHYGPALAALGRLYDPLLPRQGGIPADARQAAKAYQDAAKRGDDTATTEREALRTKLVQQRDAGDTTAKLIVQDFWP